MSDYFLIGADDHIYELPSDRGAMIGRSTINQIVLDDRLISRVHASVMPSPKGPVLTDRGSANGTQVNGRPVKETTLKHGDTVRIGKFLFYVFSGARAEAEQWISRRRGDTKTDQTITDLNVNSSKPSDMVGDLSSFDIITLLQTLVDQRRHGTLALSQSGHPVGRIFFVNGVMVHADTASGLFGKQALYDLMTLQTGEFTLQSDSKPPALSIMENPAALLMEGARLYDEKRALTFQTGH